MSKTPKEKPKRPPGRPRIAPHTSVVNITMERTDYERVREIARIESEARGKFVSTQSLMRDAINYIYADDMRVRELFRKNRGRVLGKILNRY